MQNNGSDCQSESVIRCPPSSDELTFKLDFSLTTLANCWAPCGRTFPSETSARAVEGAARRMAAAAGSTIAAALLLARTVKRRRREETGSSATAGRSSSSSDVVDPAVRIIVSNKRRRDRSDHPRSPSVARLWYGDESIVPR